MRRLPRARTDSCNSGVCSRCGRIHSSRDGACKGHEHHEGHDIRKDGHDKEHRHDKRRCPYCGHDFIWPPDPCPRCGRVHEPKKPWVSPNAYVEDDIEYPISPKKDEGAFSQLFGGGALGESSSMMNMMLLMSLFGGGMGGTSDTKNVFMNPMFQMLEKMGGMQKGGNMMEALAPMLGGDMGSLGSILANFNKGGA